MYNVQVLTPALGTLCNISENAANRMRMGTAGIVPLLVRLLAHGAMGVEYRAGWVLVNMAAEGSCGLMGGVPYALSLRGGERVDWSCNVSCGAWAQLSCTC